MIPISIDTTDLADEFGLSIEQCKSLLDYVVKDVTAEVARQWQVIAKKELGATRDEYIRSLIVSDEGPGTGVITLKGELPNMLEQGKGPFDLKTGFSRSSKKKLTADGKGWYLTIPFRHATPGSVGERADFTSIMPNEVYAVARKLSATTTNPGGGGTVGGYIKESQLPKELRSPKIRAEISIPNKRFAAYKHQSSIYAGMIRMEKFYGGAAQSSYMTFRRVSSKSDSDSWIHKGLMARNFAEKALKETRMDYIVDKAVDQFLANLGF